MYCNFEVSWKEQSTKAPSSDHWIKICVKSVQSFEKLFLSAPVSRITQSIRPITMYVIRGIPEAIIPKSGCFQVRMEHKTWVSLIITEKINLFI